MQLSTFALLIGVVWYVLGFPLVFSDKRMTAWRRKMQKDETFLRMTGTVFAVISVLVLKTQSTFTPDADGVLVVIAWIILVKALFMAWWPDQYSQMRIKFEESWMRTKQSHMMLGILMLLAGAFFTYLGLILI